MAKPDDADTPEKARKPAPDPREARLAEALRANLRRRKAPPTAKDDGGEPDA